MSIVLPSSEVNQLAGATATELAGSVLSAGSSEPENPEVSGSCPWASIDVSALVSTITTLKNTVDSLVSTVAEIKSKTDNLPESPAAAGDEMTLAQATVTSLGTAVTSGVWSATKRDLTTATLADNNTPNAVLATTANIPTTNDIWGRIGSDTTSRTITSPTTTEIANKVWGRAANSTATTRELNPAISAGGLTTDQANQLAKIFALLANWSVADGILTANLGNNQTAQFNVNTTDGEITGVSPRTT